MILVPATVRLLGERTWWTPGAEVTGPPPAVERELVARSMLEPAVPDRS